MTVLTVDFNDINGDGQLVALRRLALPSANVRVDDAVYLRDGEGNSVWGRAERVEESLVYVQPDWDTWATEKDKHVLEQGWFVAGGRETICGESQRSAGVTFSLTHNEPWAGNTAGDGRVRRALPHRQTA